MSPSSRTELASGPINNSDQLIVELIEQPGKPPIVTIGWPSKPSVCTPATYDQVAAAAMRLLAAAVVELAAIRTWRKL